MIGTSGLKGNLNAKTLNASLEKQKQMLFKIGVLKHFAIFTGKYLCCSLFLIKLQALGLQTTTLLKRDSNAGVFL